MSVYLSGVCDTWKSVYTKDELPVTLPLKGQNIPFVGFFIEKGACCKINAQAQSIAKSVGMSSSKAEARTEVLSNLDRQNEIAVEGNKRSYITIALCVGCYCLGVFPTLAVIIAVLSGLMAFAVRGGDSWTNRKILAVTRLDAEDQQILTDVHLGGLI